MQIKEIMTRTPEKIPIIASVRIAAEKMKKLDVGIIPVFKNNDIVGVVTDRDIVVRSIAEHKNASDTPVMDIMSTDVVSCPENTDVAKAAQVMEEHKVRRLIVTSDKGKPVGIVSLGDIALKAGPRVGAEVLEKVSEPSRPER